MVGKILDTHLLATLTRAVYANSPSQWVKSVITRYFFRTPYEKLAVISAENASASFCPTAMGHAKNVTATYMTNGWMDSEVLVKKMEIGFSRLLPRNQGV